MKNEMSNLKSLWHKSSHGTTQNRRFERLLQVVGRLDEKEIEPPLKTILSWLEKKKNWKSLSETIDLTPSFELEDGMRTLWVENSQGAFAIRLDEPCVQEPGRQWRVEVVLIQADDGEGVGFGCTLSVVRSPTETMDQVEAAPPAIVREIAIRHGLNEGGHRLDGSTWSVDAARDIDRLIDFLESPRRTLPILAFSEYQGQSCFVDPHVMARKFAGLGIFVELSPEACRELTRRYETSLSVYGDAMRFYRAGFHPDDNQWDHPLYVANTWKNRIQQLPFLIRRELMKDARIVHESREVPPFSEIRRLATEQRLRNHRRQMAGIDENDIQAPGGNQDFVRDLEKMAADRQDWENLAHDEEKRANELERALASARTQLEDKEKQIQNLQRQIRDGADQSAAVPANFDGLQDWAKKHLQGRVVITDKAQRAAKKSSYRDHAKAYESLLLLANEYWSMKFSGLSKEEYAQKATQLGVDVSRVGGAAINNRYADEYRTRWGNQSYLADMHLSGSSTTDPTRCLRIYFAVDAVSRVLVVASLPSHLTNTLT